jgi:hypothetical protein
VADQQGDFGSAFDRYLSQKKAGNPPDSQPKKPDKPPAPVGDFGSSFDRYLKKDSAASPPPERPAKTTGSFLTKSVLTIGGGKGFSERYEDSGFRKALEAIIPESVRQSHEGDYISRFLAETYKAAPGALDFMTSPAGIGLITLHVTPQTRRFAPILDYGFTAFAGKQAVDALKAYRDDPRPENLSHVVVALAQAYSGVKGAKTIEKIEAPAAAARLKESVGERAKSEVGRREAVERLKSTAPYTEEGDKPPSATKILESKVDVLNEIAAPKGFWEKKLKLDAVHQTPIVGDVARMLHIKTPELVSISKDFVEDRAAFESENKFRVESVLHPIKESVPAEERTIYKMGADGKPEPTNQMAAVIQGTAPKSSLSPKGQQAVEVIQKLNHESANLLKQYYGNDLQLADPNEYLTQIWEMPNRGTPAGRAAQTLMHDRFLKQKVFEDYEAGIKAGWVPKYNDVLDVVRVRWNYLTRVIANQRMANTLNDIGAVATEQQKNALHLDDWVKLDDAPALNRAAFQASEEEIKQIRGKDVRIEKSFYRYQPVYVHPQMAMAAKAIFGSRFNSPAFKTIDQVRSFGKRLNLYGSLFHNWAITEQSQAMTASTSGALKGLTRWWFADPEIYKGARTGIAEVIGKGKGDELPIFRLNSDFVRDMLHHGVRLEIDDAERSSRNFMQNMGKDQTGWKKAVTAPIRAMGHMNHVIEKSLWDFYLPANMAHSYESGVSSMIERAQPRTPAEVTAIKRAVAAQVNDAYGAISWEKMLVNPKVAQMMNWIFLAPGWKISNLRVFTQAFEGSLGREVATNYARGAALTWFLSMQVGSYLSSSIFKNKDKNGKEGGHFTWDNPGVPIRFGSHDTGLTSNSFAIPMGYMPNGSERYVNWGKGLTDPVKLAMDPHDWMMNALSGPVQAAGAAAYGVDPVTGFEYVDKYGTPLQKNIQRMELALPMFVPFSARDPIRAINDKRFSQLYPMPGGASMLFNVAGLPTRQGLSYTRAKEAYISAMKSNDIEAANIILKVADSNKLSPRAIIQEWRKYLGTQRKRAQPLPEVYNVKGQVVGGR